MVEGRRKWEGEMLLIGIIEVNQVGVNHLVFLQISKSYSS